MTETVTEVESCWIRLDWETYRDEYNVLRWRYVPTTITKIRINNEVKDVNIPISKFYEICEQVAIVYNLNPVMTYKCREHIKEYIK